MTIEASLDPDLAANHHFDGKAAGVFIVKLGGALITYKDDYCKPNTAVIKEFARVLRTRWSELQGRLILVLGGGSYGNGVPYRYNLLDSYGNWRPVDLSMMTVKTLEFMSLLAGIFREQGIPCYPFQTSSYLMTRNGEPQNFWIEPIKHALSLNVLPVLSGDMVFDSDRGFVIFSSDRIPELFVNSVSVKRVVMLTNVPGVLNESEVFRRVAPEDHELVLNKASASRQQDVSGGMKNKVKSLLRVADLGVESVICDGRDPSVLLQALFEPEPPGTFIEPREYIRRENDLCSSPLPELTAPASLHK
jgi:isopentenyl phosphate kinase